MRRLLVMLTALPLLAGAAEHKVVALGGDITEIVYALGAQSELVARDTTSTWPAQARGLPDVGYLRQLSAEGILAAHPDIVLASDRAQPSLALEQVARSGVRVITLPGRDDISVIEDKIRLVAAALNKTAEGESLSQRVSAQLQSIPASPINKRVLFILSHAGMSAMAAGEHTGADAAIRAAGLTNALQGVSRYQPLSQEGVIASRPDLVVISADGLKSMGGEAALWALPGLAQTPAGRNRQVLLVDDMALLGFSIRTPAAIRALRQKAGQLP